MRLIGCALPALMAVWLSGCVHANDKDPAAMNKVPMHSVCVGRMLVDLPKGGSMDWQQQFDRARVEKLPYSINTADKFWAYVDKRRGELEKPTNDNPGGRIVKYEKLDDDFAIVLFRPNHVDDSYIHTERYLWTNNSAYKYRTGTLSDAKAMELLSTIKRTPRALTPISNFNPPAKPGFCIDAAMVTGRIGPIWSSPSATVPGWRGVTVNVIAREDDGSRARMPWEQSGQRRPPPTPFGDLEMIRSWAAESARSSDDDRVVALDVLRKRERTLAGMAGEEVAVKANLANGQEWYRFEWNSRDDTTRMHKSGFTFDLEAGDQAYTSDYAAPPPQDELLALWDAMLDSLKRRPGSR